ncbi:MAG: HIG1 domain-containing protein [Rhodobacteraceae bacterium]|nr:HIG1 domain-containing protein [Paracoccaceae bacterium]
MNFILIIIMLLVLAVLLIGIIGFAVSPEFNAKHGNKLMRLRVTFQALAVIVIIVLGLIASSGE